MYAAAIHRSAVLVVLGDSVRSRSVRLQVKAHLSNDAIQNATDKIANATEHIKNCASKAWGTIKVRARSAAAQAASPARADRFRCALQENAAAVMMGGCGVVLVIAIAVLASSIRRQRQSARRASDARLGKLMGSKVALIPASSISKK